MTPEQAQHEQAQASAEHAARATAFSAAAKSLYGATLVNEGARVVEKAAADNVILTSAEQASETKTVRGILERYSDGSAATARELGDALAIGLRKPVTPELAKQWQEQSEAWLKAEFGARSGDVLAKAKALVKADPALARRLTGGLGNNPLILKAIVAKAAKR